LGREEREKTMIENGYKLHKNGDGTWSVIDAFKGNPITFEG
jgi:hypothetical protein